MKFNQIVYLFLTLMIMISSCKKNSEQTSTSSGGTSSMLIPLKTGNYWEFIDSSFNNGVFTYADTSRLTITGTKHVSYQGKDYTVWFWSWNNQAQSPCWFVNNESDGLHFYGGKLDSVDYFLTKQLSYKFPVQAGETWKQVSVTYSGTKFYLGDTLPTHCLATSYPFKTKAGVLSCIEFQYIRPAIKKNTIAGLQFTGIDQGSSMATEVTLFYKPDMGYVGYIGKVNGLITFTKTLSSCKLN
ncbi:MAG: hypothetical protein WCO44_06600 [Bacteroidota bacterium]